jgi:allophanate hydrolase
VLSALQPILRVRGPSKATRDFFGDELQAESYAAALDEISALGGEIKEIDFTPFYQIAQMLYEGAWVAERYSVIESLMREQPEMLHPTTRQIIGAAEKLSAADAFRGFYRLQELKRQVEPLLKNIDLLCVPTMPTFYSVAEVEADPVQPNARLGTYTNFVNLLDLCGIAVPVSKFRNIISVKKTQVETEAIMPASRHLRRLPSRRSSVKNSIAAAAQMGKRMSITPAEVAMPLPPLNLRNGE